MMTAKPAYQLVCTNPNCSYEGKIYFDTPIPACPRCNQATLKHTNLTTEAEAKA